MLKIFSHESNLFKIYITWTQKLQNKFLEFKYQTKMFLRLVHLLYHFTLELHTPRLKGLSYKDLELASMINGFDLTKYKLTPMEDVSEVRQIKRQQQIDAGNI